MTSFLIALQFLTRVPLNINIEWTEEKTASSLLWYPLIGFLIGLCLLFIANLLNAQSSMLVAALTLTFWVLITGALHMDGLADSVDAWVGSHGNKQRALGIMKDPQAGPIAIVVLGLVLIIKFSAISSLDLQGNLYLLIVPPVIARCAPLLLFLTTPYAREKGLGSAMAQYLPKELAWLVLVVVGILTAVFLGVMHAAILMIIVLGVFWYLRYLMLKFIDGMTGDTIGASIEIIEVTVLVALVIMF